MIAALFVETGGAYFGLEGVDPWDVKRNAMLYDGPHPVVAHPPCARWCRLAGLVEARWGHKRGEDGGMFAHALDCVRRFGGVLEHPATWLYAFGVDLLSLKWGSEPDTKSKALVSWCGNHTRAGDKRRRAGKAAAAATPPEFQEVLLTMARTVDRNGRERVRGPVAARSPGNWEGMTKPMAEGLTYAQIGERLGVSVSGAKGLVAAGRNRVPGASLVARATEPSRIGLVPALAPDSAGLTVPHEQGRGASTSGEHEWHVSDRRPGGIVLWACVRCDVQVETRGGAAPSGWYEHIESGWRRHDGPPPSCVPA